MAKRLMILIGMLAVMIATAAPAFAQGQVTATGVLGKLGPHPSGDPTPRYSITDEDTGTSYELMSGFVDLEPYAGERILIYGVPVPGAPPPGAPRLLNVTQVEPLGSSGEAVTATFELTVDGEVSEGQTLALRLDRGTPSRFYEGPAGDITFCATNGNPNLPVCEDGSVYSGTLQVPAGEPIAFEYIRLGEGSAIFYSDTRTFTEDTTVSATYTGDSGQPESVAATFELTVEGEPPSDATFFGYLGNGGEYVPVRLTDPDGDGVYTGSYDRVGQGDSLRTLVVQGTGTRRSMIGVYAGDPIETIKDFGDVTFGEDETLSATVSFNDEGSGAVVDVNEDGSVDEADGETAARVSDSAIEATKSSGEATLPATGGAILLPLITGLFLAFAGLLARRASR